MKDMLEGVRVLDFSSNAAGPTCAAMLADYGAEVVKIERPVTGNDERAYGIQVDGGVSPWSVAEPRQEICHAESERPGSDQTDQANGKRI